MEKEIELLNYIYQTAKMGIVNIDNIKETINNKKFLSTLKTQENSYFEITTTATDYLRELKKERTEPTNITKVISYIDLKINIMNNSTISNISSLLISNNTKTLIEIEEIINNYEGKHRKTLNLLKKLVITIKRNIDTLKKYI